MSLMPPGQRDVLIELGKRYIAAVARNSPQDVPLGTDFRSTENGQPTPPGEGWWKEVTSFPGFPTWLCDEEAKSVVAFGAVERGDGCQPFALRLAIDGGRVNEAETIISSSRKGFFADADQLICSDVLYDAPVEPARACDRDALRRIADSYWIALGESDGSLVQIDHRADRFANGKKVTNNLELLLSPDRAVHSIASMLTGTRPARPRVREKRFPILDVARGVAATFAIVDFADDPSNPRPDTGSFYILNALKIVDGRIRIIDAIHEITRRGTVSGWPSEAVTPI